MDLNYSAEDEAFRLRVRKWIADHPSGPLETLDRLGGQGLETSPVTGLGEPSGRPPRADQRESHRRGQCEQEEVGENRIHLTSVGSAAGESKRESTRA